VQGQNELPLAAFPSSLPASRKESDLGRELGIALAGLGAEKTTDRARLARYALPLLDSSLSSRSDDPVAWQARIVALTLRNRTAEATAAARTALAIAPENERTLALAIPLLAAAGECDQAISQCRSLLSVNPMASEYHLFLAKLLGQKKAWREATEACRAALDLNPLNLTARLILIRSAVATGNRALEREQAEIYLRFDPPQGERETLLRSVGEPGSSTTSPPEASRP
jgi:tetratricopeptide (TPR) repeat protein